MTERFISRRCHYCPLSLALFVRNSIRSTEIRIDTENLGESQSRIIRGQFGRLSSHGETIFSDIPFAVSSSFIAKPRASTRKKADYQKRYSTLNGATIDALQKLDYDRMQETHVLGTAYRKTIHAEMTDHFRYVLERFAELSQDVSV